LKYIFIFYLNSFSSLFLFLKKLFEFFSFFKLFFYLGSFDNVLVFFSFSFFGNNLKKMQVLK